MTPEELRALAEARTLEELDALLRSYLDAGIITPREAEILSDEYGLALGAEEGEAELPEWSKDWLEEHPPTPARIKPTYWEDIGAATDIAGTYRQYMADPNIMNYLNQYTSRNDLANRLGTLIREGYLPDERIAGQILRFMLNEKPDAKYATALQKAQTELTFQQSLAGTKDASPQALAAAQAAVDKAQSAYDAALTKLDTQSQMLIRAGAGRVQTDIEDYNARLATEAYKREAYKLDTGGRQRAWSQALARAWRSPNLTAQDYALLKDLDDQMKGDSPYLQSDEAAQMMIDRLPSIVQKAQDRQTQKQRGIQQFADKQAFQQYKTAAETDLTGRLLTEFYEGRKKKENYLPGYGYVEPIKKEMPDAGSVAAEFLKGESSALGYGKGTNLRDFILGEIPGVYEESLPARQKWLEAQNTELDPYLSYSVRQKQLQEEVLRWGELTQNSPTALKDYAERMYYKTLKEREEMKPSDYPERPSKGVTSPRQEIWGELMQTLPSELTGDAAKMTELYARAIKLRESQGKTMEDEDPFKTALRKKNFLADYFRRPGAGLVSRLTPAVRF